jgi:hypothetical protein
MPISITQVFLDDSSVKTITGKHTYDRDNGGTLVIPSGSSLPTEDIQAGEWFWLTTDNKAYRRNDGNTAWVAQLPDDHVSTHQNGGDDELSVAGLSGTLADDQPVQAHAIDGAKHTGTLDHSEISNVGTDDHHAHSNKTEIDLISDGDHDVRTDNPHTITSSQVGNTTAQWNADKLQGVSVSSSTPTTNQILKYNGSSWALADDVGIPSSAAAMFNESLGGQQVGAWPQQDVIIRETLHNSDATVFSYANNSELTFLKAGTVKLNATVSLEHIVGGGRTSGAIAIMKKPSGGSYAFVDGTTRYLYIRNHEGGNFGSMTTTLSWQVSANDTIKIVCWINGGDDTVITVADACSIDAIWMG